MDNSQPQSVQADIVAPVSVDEAVSDLVRPDTNAAALPLLPPTVDRSGERVLARFGLLAQAAPVFAPAARVPLAGLLLALLALQATGLLCGARSVFGALPNGFDGLDTVLLETALLTLPGSPAPRAPPAWTRALWVVSSAWTGPRRSRPSAASSPPWPAPARSTG